MNFWILLTCAFVSFSGLANSLAAEAMLGTWTAGPPAPTKRTEVAAAALGGKIYVVGGFSEPSLGNLANFAISRAVEVYDPSTKTWSTTTSLPEGRHHAGMVAYEDRLYVVGGFTRSFLSVWHPVSTVYRFDPSTEKWSELPPMPTARGALGVAALNGRLYAIGGFDGETNPAVVEVLDLATQQWSTAAPLPTPRDHLAVVSVGSQIFAIGGRPELNYHRNMATVEMYDSVSDRWQSRASLPTARSGIAAGVIDGWIYVVGGESERGTFATNEAYHPQSDRWQTMAPMPTARHGLGAAVLHGRLYALAGGPTPGGSFSNLNEIFTPPSPHGNTTRSRATPAQVGAIMALLATFDKANVLPPETSAQANQIIHALIQVQAAITKSTHPSLQAFVRAALESRWGAQADSVLAEIRRQGLTAEVLEVLIDYGKRRSIWDDSAIADGFLAFHVTRNDWQLLEEIVHKARHVFQASGTSLQRVFEQQRQHMPGASQSSRSSSLGN
ncbi:MAG: hypothetical protein D6690_10930 [Nitrospirae bacterium]|nr:MAG: hypothetical protein D6690_10930 [Nitrospirota bacterium]